MFRTHSRGRRYAAILLYGDDAMFGKRGWLGRSQVIHHPGATLYDVAVAAHRAGLWSHRQPGQASRELREALEEGFPKGTISFPGKAPMLWNP